MVQRIVEPSAEPLNSKRTGNSSLSWQGPHFPQNSERALGKIGDMLFHLTNGEIKVPVGFSFQQRRSYEADTEELELVPGCKRSKLMEMSDVSFKTPSWVGTTPSGTDTSALPGESRPLQMLARTRLPLTVSTTHSYHPLDEPSPLGLTLKKTPSFLDLVAMTVGQGCGNADLLLTDGSSQGPSNRAGLPTACTGQGKLKASNFPASTLKIGPWERTSRYEGDVVAKCYYAKRKLVWEVLESGLKSKIELQWSDISAIRANYGDGQPGILEVEVSRPPLFFKETNPQPRKHTLWEATSDFTGGEATICKRHCLQFPEGVLNKHYEKLLQCDARLKSLAGHSSVVPERHLQELMTNVSDESKDHSLPRDARKQLMCPLKVKIEMPVLPVEYRCSSSSVMESRGSDDSDTEECGAHDDVSSSSHALISAEEASGKRSLVAPEEQKPPRGVFFLTGDLTTSDKDVLNEIAQILLGESNAAKASPERGLIRVSSMSGFLSEDGPWLPTSYAVADWSLPEGHGSEGYGSDDRKNNTVIELLDEKPFKHGIVEGAAGSTNNSLHESVKQCFSRHGSSGDLLVNLPRIASLPQLFENGAPRRDSHLSFVGLM